MFKNKTLSRMHARVHINVKYEWHVYILTVTRMHLTSHAAPNNPKPDTKATRTPMAIANREILPMVCSKVVAFSWSILNAGKTSLPCFNFKTIPATISTIPSNYKAQPIRDTRKKTLFDYIFYIINKQQKDIERCFRG